MVVDGYPIGMTNEQDFDNARHDDSSTATDPGAGEGAEAFGAAGADRAPTPDEVAAAEAARDHVDLDAVAAEYEHMNELGANVRGEGQIEPE